MEEIWCRSRFLPDDAVRELAANGATDDPRALIDQLVASGVIERRTPGGYVVFRFSLDPAAEYLAAIWQLFKLKTASHEEWQVYLSKLQRMNEYPRGPEGYLMALATCYRAYKSVFSLVDVHFPWDEDVDNRSSNAPAWPLATSRRKIDAFCGQVNRLATKQDPAGTAPAWRDSLSGALG